MLSLSLNDLKLVAKFRGIKGYKNMSKERLLSALRESKSDAISQNQTSKKLRFHSRNEVSEYQTQFGEWKIQLTMSINFISSKECDEIRIIHTKSII